MNRKWFLANRAVWRAWIPALLAVAVICVESTNGMGLKHTNAMLANAVRWTGHAPTAVDPFNRLFRKVGHCLGYGLLGMCFARGWAVVLRRKAELAWKAVSMRSGVLGVVSACVVASCDELHQRFLPSRQASVHDVLLDTCGAVMLIAVSGLFALRRQAMARMRAMHTDHESYGFQSSEVVFEAS